MRIASPGLFGRLRDAALCLTAGTAAALAHPPFGFLPGLLGYGLLLGLLERVDPERPLRAGFWRGFCAGGAYFLISCWWVAEAFLVDAANQAWMAPLAVVGLAVLLGLFWGLAGLIYAGLKPRQPLLKVLVFAGALSLFEWLRGHVLTGFPWNLPGETWRAGTAPSQAAALVGAYGLTWWTLAIVAGLCAPLALGRTRSSVAAAAAGLAGLGLLYGFGALRLVAPHPVMFTAPVVRIVQADVRQESKYDSAKFQDIVGRYLRLTAKPSAPDLIPDVIIWPEGALPASANDLFSPQSWTLSAINQALLPGQTLMIGAYRAEGDPGQERYYNSLLALRSTPHGLLPTAVYDKFRLVPFGEFLPLERVLTPLGFKDLAHIGDGFTPGRPPRPIRPLGLPEVQPLICYESLFPGLIRQGPRPVRRAEWIVNVTNDAWFGPTSGPLQHLNLASYRAIEEGLPMIRATPTGVSAVIDAYGRIRPGESLPLGAEGVIDARLPSALDPTPFSRYGDRVFWIMMTGSLIALLGGVRRRV